MREYSFKYTDSGYIIKLFLVSFFVAILTLFITVTNANIFGPIVSVTLSMVASILIFILNKKKIKKFGVAHIFISHSEFKLAGFTEYVYYSNIRTYQIERSSSGVHLRIKFKDGNEFKLQANSNFCDDSQYNTFCQEFEKVIQQYKTENNVELIRKPSMFEQAWMLPFLIVLTVSIIGFFILIFSQGKRIPPALFTSLVVTIPMWLGYLKARSKTN